MYSIQKISLDILDNVGNDVTTDPSVSLPPSKHLKEAIENVIDHQIVSTRHGGYQKYLVKWKGRPLSDCTWITDDKFQHLDTDLYEKFHAFNLPGRVLSSQGELMENGSNQLKCINGVEWMDLRPKR